MTPADMDQLTEPAETGSLQPPETFEPVSLKRKSSRPQAWLPALRLTERRWWTVALAGSLLITAFGIGLLYMDDSDNQAAIRTLTTQNESLTGRTQILQDQLRTTQTNLTASLGELARTKAQLEHPQLLLWSSPQQIKDSSTYLAGGIPDTFTYHLVATSTGPMSVSILTLEDFAKALQCVDYGTGVTNWCMHHTGHPINSWLGVTSVSYDFHLAEGCADYLAVFTAASSVTVKPNVSVTYNPATTATGTCG